MISLRQRLRMALPTILLLLISAHQIESFQFGPKSAQNNKPTFRFSQNRHLRQIKSIGHRNSLSTLSSTELDAKKKKGEEEPLREKKNALELVILYMTPWRNPNSIFVYLFAGVYFLGKYSEATLASGGTL